MQNIGLYSATVLIWGSTWYAITFQLGVVSADMSVAYRFALAAFILFIYSALRGQLRHLHFSRKDHIFIALQGLLLFCLNYYIFYLATGYMTSGLVAVTFSMLTFMNIINQAVFFKIRVDFRTMLASLVGFFGIIMVFKPEIAAFTLESDTVTGLILGIIATYLASLGNMAALRNSKAGLPVVRTNTFGMLYGAIAMLSIGLASGSELIFDESFDYIWSLVYLSLFGSVLAFGCYLSLIARIGADKGAYVAVLFPVVALTISTLFENYQWSQDAVVGLILILAGNVLILAPKRS